MTRKLKPADVVFEVFVEPEDMPVRGNFDDKELEDQIIEASNAGSIEAWCWIRVVATWTAKDGAKFSGTDSLGGCSFLSGVHESVKSQIDLCIEDHDMRGQALTALQSEVDAAARRRADAKVLLALDAVPTATLQSWVKRSFMTVVPLAKAELARRKLR